MTTESPLRLTPPTNPNGYWDGEFFRYDVDFYTVTAETELIIKGVKVKSTSIISPLFATIEQAREFKAAVLEQNPECKVIINTAYYMSPDERGRQDMLAEIVWPE